MSWINNVYYTTPMFQVPTLHCPTHKNMRYSTCPKGEFLCSWNQKIQTMQHQRQHNDKSSTVRHRQQRLWNVKTWRDLSCLLLIELFDQGEDTAFRPCWIVLDRHTWKGLVEGQRNQWRHRSRTWHNISQKKKTS